MNLFTGYTIKYYNSRNFYVKGYKTFKETNGRSGISPWDFYSHVLIERILPSLVMTTMLGLLHGDLCGEDEKCGVEDAKAYGIDLLMFQFIGRYLTQDLVGVLAMAISGEGRRSLQSAALTGVDTARKAAYELGKAYREDNWDRKTAIAFARILEYFQPLLKPVEKGAAMVIDEE
jgi:hypothetical protein